MKTTEQTERSKLIPDSGETINGGTSAAIPLKGQGLSKKTAEVLSFVDYDTMRRLCMLLNPPDIFGNDWRMLADKMGFTFLEIRNIEREKNPTQALLLLYKTRTGKGTKDLLTDLHDYTLSMGREDCATLLKDTLEGENANDVKIDMSDLTCGRKSVLTEHVIDASEFYYGRLCCLLLKEGTIQIRNYLLNNLPSGYDNICDLLRNNKYKTRFRLLREREMLTQNQFNTLYPPSCAADPYEFDQALLFILIKNLVNKGDLDWRKYPQEDELEPEHDVIRLRHLRHQLIHKSKTDLSQSEFERLFNEITEILLRMGQTPESMRKYRDRVSISEIPELKQEYSKAVSQLKEEFIRTTMAADFTPTRKFNRFMILIILCFVLLSVGVSVFVGIYLSKPNETSKCAEKAELKINMDSGMFRYKSRDAWGARPRIDKPTPLKTPTQYVIIMHTAGLDCVEMIDCCQSVVETQNLHMDKNRWSDIGYNFLIGSYGVVYEGRGWEVEGAHTRSWNGKAIGIAFIGDFRLRLPDDKALQALEEILHYGVVNNFLMPNYILYGQCQVRPFMSPGEELYNKLMTLPHWRYRDVPEDAELDGNRTQYCFDKRPPRTVTIPT
ncbi:unnamed protein product [Owenia fusiformis]|uniref:Uncharacterized protein n=1 Tax=Owenia fusiformis TaxID=6347 RepID=A0A8J1THJ8_OWEFU|nr:unnamed protein product [Owenia fusiformis]